MSRRFLFIILMMVSIFVAACDEKETVIEVQSVAISQPSAEMVIGETLTLKATVSPSNASYDGITWTSTNPKVASVSTSGLVTAISEGSTTVSIMAGGKTASCAITVVKGFVAVSSISLNKTLLEMVEGDSETLVASVLPDDATDKTVTWTSSNERVATVQDGTVTAIKEGEATVTAVSGGINATCRIIVEKNNVPDAVDLGLSVKWASFNLGATKPEEYGDYFAWGETEPKDDYSMELYKWCMGSYKTMTKYCNDPEYGYNGFTDFKIVQDLEDDVAHVNLGGNWRIPTNSEFIELQDNCTWEWTSMNGVDGQKVTGPNGNSIFLPAAGYRDGTNLYDPSHGNYWSSSIYTNYPVYARRMSFSSDFVASNGLDIRYRGWSIRPVYGEFVAAESVSLNKTTLTLLEGGKDVLTATIAPANATEKTVTWFSSDTAVATVSSEGAVSAVSPGLATITAWASNGIHSATCSLTVIPIPEGVDPAEAVDLGLPSGLKWASCNLGATKPEEYGDYFAWGETEPYYSSLDPLIWKEGKEAGYITSSYRWCFEGNDKALTKYCYDPAYGYNGFTDTKTVLDPEDDAAHVNLGGSWRMPTEEEYDELLTQCILKWIQMNGVNGLRVTGPNGKSIFLPAAGYRLGTGSLYEDKSGHFLSSSLGTVNTGSAWCISIHSLGVGMGDSYRSFGYSIRPVCD